MRKHSEYLKYFIFHNNFKKKDFAQLIGVSESTVSNILSGRIPAQPLVLKEMYNVVNDLKDISAVEYLDAFVMGVFGELFEIEDEQSRANLMYALKFSIIPRGEDNDIPNT